MCISLSLLHSFSVFLHQISFQNLSPPFQTENTLKIPQGFNCKMIQEQQSQVLLLQTNPTLTFLQTFMKNKMESLDTKCRPSSHHQQAQCPAQNTSSNHQTKTQEEMVQTSTPIHKLKLCSLPNLTRTSFS